LDEARIGQTGRTCRRWFEKGVRPRGRRDLRHTAAYLFGAVCPGRDHGVALVLPEVSTAAMQAMLDELATAVTPGAHAVVILDRAGPPPSADGGPFGDRSAGLLTADGIPPKT
jgi:DDE superfamily endonuclease